MNVRQKIFMVMRQPMVLFRYYYGGVRLWPPRNFRDSYNFRFFLVDVPLRWVFKGLLPQTAKGDRFNTYFDEHKFIDNFFGNSNFPGLKFCDVGAGDGIDMSNTFQLACAGSIGFSIEGDAMRFAQLSLNYESFENVQLYRGYVNSRNISSLISGSQIGSEFDLLNLDIDSTDLHVLRAILANFRPKLVVCEWNRNYPPSIYFTVNDSDEIKWDSKQGFFMGASISAFEFVFSEFSYKMIAVQGAALFAIPDDTRHDLKAKSAIELWEEYLSGPTRWREIYSELVDLDMASFLIRIRARLAEYNGLYELRVTNSPPNKNEI